MDDEEREDYVAKKLNEAFFEKLQAYGGDRGKEKQEDIKPEKRDTSETPSRSKSVRSRRRSSVVTLDEPTQVKITKPKRRNSTIQDERSIHDAYHTILNEFKRVRNIYFLLYRTIPL